MLGPFWSWVAIPKIAAVLFIIVSSVLLFHIASQRRICMIGHVRIIDNPAIPGPVLLVNLAQSDSRSYALAKHRPFAMATIDAITCAALVA